MKKALKTILWIVIGLYLVIAIFTTACLLKRNDYKVTQFGSYSFLIPSDDELGEKYKEGTLLIIEKTDNSTIKVGDNIFFYNSYSGEASVAIGEVVKIQKVNATETTYTMKNNYSISSQYVLGREKNTSTNSFLGAVLSVLESKWGFLFIIVFPLLLAFIYEIYAIYKEIKEGK